MDDQTRLNLSESLRSTATDLTEAAKAVASLGSDADGIKRQADILDHIAADARNGADILRRGITWRDVAARLPRRVPAHRPTMGQTPGDAP